MEQVVNLCNSVIDIISKLTTEQITLISVLLTLIFYVSSRKAEIKFKKTETRREEYKKFIDLLQKTHTGKFKVDEKSKKEFFDTGVSLLIYGSKNVYRKYMFFREYSTNPIIQKSKYNEKTVCLYIIADILKTIRHEVGMVKFGELESNEALSFFVNDIGMNPLSKVQAYKAKYCIFMLKAELFAVDRYNFVLIKKVYYFFLKPILGVFYISFKYLLMIPFGKLLSKIFPNWAKNIVEESSNETKI